MTIQYSDQFFKLLLRWKGSLWKTIWKDLLVFLMIYYVINAVYRFALNEQQKVKFENVVILLKDYISQIPLTFLLGFYVGMVVQRWWIQFSLLSWPDQFLYTVSAHIKGKNEEARVIRRSIARYCILAAVLAWRSVSIRVLRRFPTDDHLIEYGLITEAEHALLKQVHVHFDPHKDWFIPLNWVQTILVRCLEQKRLTHTQELKFLLDELSRYRQGFTQLFLYQWVNIPLVYTQVATIAVYGYFGLCLIGRQYPFHNDRGQVVDMYVPVVTILQFVFYVGWLKVGEDLINPMGADDEDFELNYLLDRNLEMSFLIVDDLHMQMPRLYTDSLQEDPDAFPHTNASMKVRGYAPKPKLNRTVFKAKELEIIIPPEIAAILDPLDRNQNPNQVRRKICVPNLLLATSSATTPTRRRSHDLNIQQDLEDGGGDGAAGSDYEMGAHGGVRRGQAQQQGAPRNPSKLLCDCLRGASSGQQEDDDKVITAPKRSLDPTQHHHLPHQRRQRKRTTENVNQPVLLVDDSSTSSTAGGTTTQTHPASQKPKVSTVSMANVPISSNNGPANTGIV